MERLFWLVPLVLIVALIVWGPKRLPEVGAGMGHAIREFRNAMSGHAGAASFSPPPVPGGRDAYAEPRPWTPTSEERPGATVPDDTRRG